MNGAWEVPEGAGLDSGMPVIADLLGFDLTIGQALADAVAWRQDRNGPGDGEQIGLYCCAAHHLSIPGDITRGPGAWHTGHLDTEPPATSCGRAA